jgi:hypothetical protein
MTDRCHACDQPVATDRDWATMPPGDGEHLCWGGLQCVPIDWRSRALAAEAERCHYARALHYIADDDGTSAHEIATTALDGVESGRVAQFELEALRE